MSAPVSVIIPTWQAAAAIGPCLAALTDGVIEGVVGEVLIVDAGSGDGIEEIAAATGAQFLTAPKGRGTQLGAGAAAASRPWLLFVHADTVLAPGWPAAVRAHIADAPGRAGYFRLRFASTATMALVTAGWANLRSALFALPYGDQALLIHREAYEAAGGYPPVPLLEDVMLVRALGRRRLAPIRAIATTSPERYERDGWVRRGWRNITTVALHFAGWSPERLAERYTRK